MQDQPEIQGLPALKEQVVQQEVQEVRVASEQAARREPPGLREPQAMPGLREQPVMPDQQEVREPRVV